MLQRIQTVYLLIVAALFIALIFLPLAEVNSGVDTYILDVTGFYSQTQPDILYPTWSLFAIAALISVLAMCIIFLYKKRVVQIRLCIYNALLIIGFCTLAAFWLWKFSNTSEGMSVSLRIWASFPVIALIINYLAIRNIGADETLVRSLERLR